MVPVYALADHCLLLGTRPSLHHAPANFSLQLSLRGGRGSRWEDRKRCHPPVVPLVTFSHHPSPFLTLSKTDLEEERKRVSPRPL